jgi:hypothetical protein
VIAPLTAWLAIAVLLLILLVGVLLTVIAWQRSTRPLDMERLARALNELDDGNTLVCLTDPGPNFDVFLDGLPDGAELAPRAVARLIVGADANLHGDGR